jgi:hypothetical protein
MLCKSLIRADAVLAPVASRNPRGRRCLARAVNRAFQRGAGVARSLPQRAGTWLLVKGWCQYGLIDPAETPGKA